MPRVAAIGVHRHEMPIGSPARNFRLVGAIGEIDFLRVAVRHRIARDALAAVEERFHFGARRIQAAIGIARDMQHADAAAGLEERIHVFAVVMGWLERMALGKQHPCHRREPRVAEKQAAFGLPRGEIERVRFRRLGRLWYKIS